jgi:hypothetical protein
MALIFLDVFQFTFGLRFWKLSVICRMHTSPLMSSITRSTLLAVCWNNLLMFFFSLSTSPNQPLDSVRAASQSCFYNILSPFHYRIYCCVEPLRPVVVKLTYNQHSQQSISLFSLMWQ